jgi:aspartyl-tRNA(Asn)/glutamyl-tRNA(Gln) amidotransferase subunit A
MSNGGSSSPKGLLQGRGVSSAFQTSLQEADRDIGAFLSIDVDTGLSLREAEVEQPGGPLDGVPFAIKDNIAVKGMPLTCGSRMLEHYRSPYTASAVKRLLKGGAVAAGKTNLDEFGMGSGTENSALGKTVNPWDFTRVAGGSSGGSAAAVAMGMVPFALGSDTGGSVRQPANFCGVYGLKPTYGAVSRYGLVAYASSLECIGILADTPQRIATVFESIQGVDEHDQSTRTTYSPAPELRSSGTIGVLRVSDGLDEEVRRSYEQAAEQFRALGWKTEPVNIDSFEYAVPSYYTIAAAEASANLARYTGVRYGYRDTQARDIESMTRQTREYGFGEEVKLRILLGTYVLRSGFQDKYYIKAQKIRSNIQHDMVDVFSRFDMLMMPVFPTQAYPAGGGLTPFQQKLADRFTITANLAGVPALSIPTGTARQLPLGIQLVGPYFGESVILQAAQKYAQAHPAQRCPNAMNRAEVQAWE